MTFHLTRFRESEFYNFAFHAVFDVFAMLDPDARNLLEHLYRTEQLVEGT
ncbi:MAG: hypothetical protein P8L85_16150 [Rubripirellula sp.]|nr:hypothetical protein [Rubripirellula sp.]